MSAVTLENIEQAYQLMALVVHRSALDLSYIVVKFPGEVTFLNINQLIDDIVLVDEDDQPFSYC
jgi:hypothetical protein